MIGIVYLVPLVALSLFSVFVALYKALFWRQQRPPGRAILKKVASVHPLTESHCVTTKCDCAPVPDCVTL